MIDKTLIGLAGKARSGKDTVGKYLRDSYPASLYAFADPIKKACSEMFGLPLWRFYDNDTISREEVDPFWDMSPRMMTQLVGTNCGRCEIRQDIWLKRAEMELKEGSTYPIFVVTDVRFENEMDWICDQGGVVWYVDRDEENVTNKMDNGSHISEHSLNHGKIDEIINNNGTLDELYRIVDGLIELRVKQVG